MINITDIIYIFLIVIAILIVVGRNLRNAIILLGIFSLLISLAYLNLKAPDVAIAEAVIGSTLGTLLYLVALRRYKEYTIFFIDNRRDKNNEINPKLLTEIEKYSKSLERDCHIVYTREDINYIASNYNFDLIVVKNDTSIQIHSLKSKNEKEKFMNYMSKSKSINENLITYNNCIPNTKL